jgi:uncharacterized membrane protein YfcA
MILSTIIASGGMYVLSGSLAGFIAGLFGIGGGVILVPALIFIFQHDSAVPPNLVMHIAAGTSLAVMFLTSQASLKIHYRLNGILWNIYRRLYPGLILGTIVGVLFSSHLSTKLLQHVFALFLLLVGAKMICSKSIAHLNHRFPVPWINRLASFVIGFSSGLLGIGGGTLVTPYLNFMGVELRKTVALSALTTMTIAFLGSLTCIIVGWAQPNLPAYSTGYIYWPAVMWLVLLSSFFAQLGAKLAYLLPARYLQYGFAFLLFLVAIHLLL